MALTFDQLDAWRSGAASNPYGTTAAPAPTATPAPAPAQQTTAPGITFDQLDAWLSGGANPYTQGTTPRPPVQAAPPQSLAPVASLSQRTSTPAIPQQPTGPNPLMLADFAGGITNPHYLQAMAAPNYLKALEQYAVGTPGTLSMDPRLQMDPQAYANMLAPQPMQGPVNGVTPVSDIYSAAQQFPAQGGYQNYLNTFSAILNPPRQTVGYISPPLTQPGSVTGSVAGGSTPEQPDWQQYSAVQYPANYTG